MTQDANLDLLLSLLEQALSEADKQGHTLAAALLAESIEAVETSRLQWPLRPWRKTDDLS